jgi:hypothetical protein
MTNIHQHLVAARGATTAVARFCVVAVVLSSCIAVLIRVFKKCHHMGEKTQHRNSEVQLLIQVQFGAQPHSHCVQRLLPHRRLLLLPAYSTQSKHTGCHYLAQHIFFCVSCSNSYTHTLSTYYRMYQG